MAGRILSKIRLREFRPLFLLRDWWCRADGIYRKEKTLASAVESLMDCVNPKVIQGAGKYISSVEPTVSKSSIPRLISSTDLIKTIDSILALAAQASSTHSRPVHLAAFESLKTLFDRLASVPDLELDSPDLDRSLSKLLFDPSFEGLSEAIRLKCAQAIVAVSKIEGVELKERVESEMAREKSPVVRKELEKAGVEKGSGE